MEFTKPIDMPRGTHYGNNYFAVYSHKLKRVAHFYSNLEYYNFLSLETNPEVEMFCEQPLKIEIVHDNQVKSAIFDMWVRYKNGSEEFQEIKYSSELSGNDAKSLRSQEQIRREEAWCKENNVNFVVRTEKDISIGRFYLKNISIIASRTRRYIPTEDNYYNPRILKALKDNKKLTFQQLIENRLLPIDNELNHLCYMYCCGLINLDIANKPLDRKTEVTLWQKK